MKTESHEEVRELPVGLTREELEAVAHKLSRRLADLAAKKEAAAAVAKKYRAEADEIAAQIGTLAETHRTGRELRPVRVIVSIVGTLATIIDAQTGVILDTEPAEKQPELDLKMAAAGDDGARDDAEPPPAADPPGPEPDDLARDFVPCAEPGCESARLAPNAFCAAHEPAFVTCGAPGCTERGDLYGFCIEHAPELCDRSGCRMPREDGSHFCAEHAPILCKHDGCTRLANAYGCCVEHIPTAAGSPPKKRRPKRTPAEVLADNAAEAERARKAAFPEDDSTPPEPPPLDGAA
jgi:hypothetical protein